MWYFNLLHFILIISGLHYYIHISFCQVDVQYESCGSRFQCANFTNTDYPFWGGDRAPHCGHPAFRLDCEDDVTLITLRSRPYRVLGIDTRSLLISVARAEFLKNTCPSIIYNTDLDYRLFRHPSGDQNLTLAYGCTAVPGQQQVYEFNCTLNGTSSGSFYFTQAALLASDIARPLCSDSITVPINQTSAQLLTPSTSSENDLREVLRAGFGLIWEANDTSCNECSRSGGRCGYNSNTSSFACYCSDQPHPSHCNGTQLAYSKSFSLLCTLH